MTPKRKSEAAKRRLSPVIFLNLSNQFLRAASREFEEAGVSVSFPGYFLAARGIELGLKAYLLVMGKEESDLRRVSHDLEAALAEARRLGLDESFTLTPEEETILSWVNQTYEAKNLEYVPTGYFSLPDPNLVLNLGRRLMDALAPRVRRWRPA